MPSWENTHHFILRESTVVWYTDVGKKCGMDPQNMVMLLRGKTVITHGIRRTIFFFRHPPYFGISGLFHLGIPFRLFRSFVPRHPIVLEKSTPPWFRTSFHENAWNMANRSNFVKIVIFVSFFETYYFLGAPKHKRSEKQNATRAQFCATRAQFCATRAQFEKVVHFAKIH